MNDFSSTKSARITFRLLPEERDTIAAAAEAKGYTVSQYVEAAIQLFQQEGDIASPSTDRPELQDEYDLLCSEYETLQEDCEKIQQANLTLQETISQLRQTAQQARLEYSQIQQDIAKYERLIFPLYQRVQREGLYDTSGNRVSAIDSPLALLRYFLTQLKTD